MSYSRSYENISLKYSLPYRRFHPSFILKDYVDRVASYYHVTPEDVIDGYVGLYLKDLEKKVTQMIYHDGNEVTSEEFPDCIVEDVIKSEGVVDNE